MVIREITVSEHFQNRIAGTCEKKRISFSKIYYPYPDYKFPTEIFTDASLTTNHYGKNYPIYTDKTVDLFSESAGIEAMKKEQIADRFVNSFLLVAGKQELEEKKKFYM